MQAVSIDFYVCKLINSISDAEGYLEIKKQATFKRGVRSKVLVVYSLESDTNQLDMEIRAKKYEGFKYLSYKRSSPSQRVYTIAI